MIIYLREKGLAQILIGIVTVAFVVGSVFLYGSSKSGGGSTPEEIASFLLASPPLEIYMLVCFSCTSFS